MQKRTINPMSDLRSHSWQILDFVSPKLVSPKLFQRRLQNKKRLYEPFCQMKKGAGINLDVNLVFAKRKHLVHQIDAGLSAELDGSQLFSRSEIRWSPQESRRPCRS